MSEKDPQRYRSKIRIYFDILQAIRENPDARVTHLIHKANLPHDRLTFYLVQMEKAGLILMTADEDNKRFSVTEKGLRLVSEFNKMQGWVNAFGLEL
jgi:predicted transcriptional regulator